MKILVTGASGFIGRHVVEEAAAAGHVPVPWARSGEAPAVPQGGRDADTVIHLAWYAQPTDYLDSAENLASLAATLRLAQAFQAQGGRRFVGVGTCLEYAASLDPLREDALLQPESLYATCKAAAASVLQAFAGETKLSLAWARIFHLYGPGEAAARLLPSAIAAARGGSALALRDPGKVIDLLHVRDVARALVAIAASTVEGAINVCSGVPTVIGELVDSVGVLAGLPRDRPRTTGPPAATRVGDPSRLLRTTSFRPAVELAQGLAEAVRAHRGAP
jgi:nucleoside-diphosphate-sugar epimerase